MKRPFVNATELRAIPIELRMGCDVLSYGAASRGRPPGNCNSSAAGGTRVGETRRAAAVPGDPVARTSLWPVNLSSMAATLGASTATRTTASFGRLRAAKTVQRPLGVLGFELSSRSAQGALSATRAAGGTFESTHGPTADRIVGLKESRALRRKKLASVLEDSSTCGPPVRSQR